METICLTVQSNGNGGFRLGINTSDSKRIFKCRGVTVALHLPNIDVIHCNTACGVPCNEDFNRIDINPNTNLPYRKKGYDSYSTTLSKWLKDNQLTEWEPREPPKLKFGVCIEEINGQREIKLYFREVCNQ